MKTLYWTFRGDREPALPYETTDFDAEMQIKFIDYTRDDVLSATVTLFDVATRQILNNRVETSVLDLVQENGKITWPVRPADNVFVSTDEKQLEEMHVIRLQWTWSAPSGTRMGIQDYSFHVRRLIEPIPST